MTLVVAMVEIDWLKRMRREWVDCRRWRMTCFRLGTKVVNEGEIRESLVEFGTEEKEEKKQKRIWVVFIWFSEVAGISSDGSKTKITG